MRANHRERSVAAVEARGLKRLFGDFVAVDGIDIHVLAGEIFGFLGPNGAGKSTTIRMLCGLLKPSAGEGTVAGCDIVREPERIKQHIGYMSQRFSLYEDLTAEQNLRFYMGIYRLPPSKREARLRFALEMSGLSGRRDVIARDLPTGWRQRLALGCAILHEPPILFLDEPTSGVDPISRRSFWELIQHLSHEGTTVFVTTHYMDEAEYCDRLALIDRGKIVALGSPGELRRGFVIPAILEVEAAPLLEALEAIRGLPGIRDAAFFGQRLHVRADDETRGAAQISRALDERGIRLGRIERVMPSLEDVFVALIQDRDHQESMS